VLLEREKHEFALFSKRERVLMLDGAFPLQNAHPYPSVDDESSGRESEHRSDPE